MIEFETGSKTPSSSTMPRVASLVLMLLVALGLLLFASTKVKKSDVESPGQPIETTTVEPTTSEDQLVSAVDHDRLANFADHARQNDLDWDAYFHLLRIARDNPPDRLREMARKDVTFAMLFNDPDRYRGEVLLLRGRLHRLIQYPAVKNDEGIPIQYEGWLFTGESGKFPYTLVMADAPRDIEPAATMRVNCEVVGYFLGWWRFDTTDGKPSSAPFIMVSSIRRLDPSLSRTQWNIPLGWLAVGVAGTLLVTLMAVAYLVFRSGHANQSVQVDVNVDSLTFDANDTDPTESDSEGSGGESLLSDDGRPRSNGASHDPRHPSPHDLD